MYSAEVNVSISGILPLAYAAKTLVVEPIAKCIGDATPYKEGAGTFVLGAPANNSTTSANDTSATNGSTVSGTGSAPAVAGKASSALSIVANNGLAMAAAGSSVIVAVFTIVF